MVKTRKTRKQKTEVEQVVKKVFEESMRRPLLVQCGRHFIDPHEVSTIRKVRPNLWVVKLKSEPNSTFPVWMNEHEVSHLLTFFNIVGDEIGEEDANYR